MCIKCMYRMGSTQRLPQIMCAWERMRILKRICGFKGLKQNLNACALLCVP